MIQMQGLGAGTASLSSNDVVMGRFVVIGLNALQMMLLAASFIRSVALSYRGKAARPHL